MADSDSNSNSSSPWPPYPSYMDCSQRLCSIYCPQWCYVFPPPPQFDLSNEGDRSSSLASDFSPLIIAVVGVLATAFLLITYLTFISKHCRNRRPDRTSVSPEFDDPGDTGFDPSHHRASAGLEESVIKSIAVCKYKKGDGFVEGTECSVCLGEFEDGESLRLLPKCSHAFHIPCIDTWLESHATCPLCRCAIPPVIVAPAPAPQLPNLLSVTTTNTSSHPHHARHDTVLEVRDLEARAEQEAQARHESESIVDIDDKIVAQLQPQPLRRSVSLDSWSRQGRTSIADVLLTGHEDHPDGNAAGSHCSNADAERQISGQDPDGVVTRSVSTGRTTLFKCRHGLDDRHCSSAAPC
uniref:RING-type E3 ubiquitin transferase n=1 Tax=Kalanchoe fedtschenkoi TaxID=63787 RepID=A0A7N0V7C7_KALFE